MLNLPVEVVAVIVGVDRLEDNDIQIVVVEKSDGFTIPNTPMKIGMGSVDVVRELLERYTTIPMNDWTVIEKRGFFDAPKRREYDQQTVSLIYKIVIPVDITTFKNNARWMDAEEAAVACQHFYKDYADIVRTTL